MIDWPTPTRAHWRSAGGEHWAGEAIIHDVPVCIAHLGAASVAQADILGLSDFMANGLPERNRPLILSSACPGFAVDADAEARGIILDAGRYRACQQRERDAGRRLNGVIDDIAVGGTYLMHGLSAPHRIAVHGTRFYDTVYNAQKTSVPLEDVQQSGLITEIVAQNELFSVIARLIAPSHG